MKISFNCQFLRVHFDYHRAIYFFVFLVKLCLPPSKAFTDMLGARVMLECKRGCHKGVDSPQKVRITHAFRNPTGF